MRGKNLILAVAGALTLAAAQTASAGYVNEYTYLGKTIEVFTLSTWSGAPGGATMIETNQAWTNGSSVTVPSSVEVLVVGGGGGTGGGASGGGGAGGLAYNSSYTPSSGTVTVTVGAGVTNTSGNQSVFDNMWADGGGLGLRDSHGGAQGNSFDGVNTITGTTYTPGMYSAGSGAGGAGGNGNNGNGGPGVQNAITGTLTYYAAGGGAPVNGKGGSGIGGNGATAQGGYSTDGFANTGSGGGGDWLSPLGYGGAGSSGIVIVSYTSAPPVPEPASLSVLGLGSLLLLRRRRRA